MQWDDFWDRMLCDVERLLVHVVGRGYRLQDEQGAALLQAREARRDGVLSSEAATGLVNLFGALSLQAKPVTAASLSNSAGASFEGAIQRYRNYVIVLTALIVPISLATFVSFGLTTLMKKDLDAANSLALSLQGELPQQAAPATGSPAAVLPPGVTQGEINEQLQQLSTTLRVVYNRAVIVRQDQAAGRDGAFHRGADRHRRGHVWRDQCLRPADPLCLARRLRLSPAALLHRDRRGYRDRPIFGDRKAGHGRDRWHGDRLLQQSGGR
jgi:hypothetical protein